MRARATDATAHHRLAPPPPPSPPPTPTQNTPHNTHPRTKNQLLALELLRVVLENAGPAFRSSERFSAAIRQYLCLSLLKNSASSIPAALQLSAGIFLTLLLKFRAALKAEVRVGRCVGGGACGVWVLSRGWGGFGLWFVGCSNVCACAGWGRGRLCLCALSSVGFGVRVRVRPQPTPLLVDQQQPPPPPHPPPPKKN